MKTALCLAIKCDMIEFGIYLDAVFSNPDISRNSELADSA